MIIAVTRLHYGLDYLPWVIKSSKPIADRHLILYTHEVSFWPGMSRDENPDSGEALREAAVAADPDRVVWVDHLPIDVWSTLRMFPAADAILELDADEIISPQLCASIRSELGKGSLTKRVYRVPFLHHWRSFDYVCKNPGWPTRLFLPGGEEGEDYFPGGEAAGYIHHFGYARKRADMRYKAALSMHKPEWREGWWEEKYDRFPEVLEDVHPCVADLWTAEPYDKRQLPDILRNHPYYDLEVIE